MTRRRNFALGLGSLLLCAAFSAPVLEDLMKPQEQENLGKQLAAYFNAYAKQSGTDKAFEKVSDEIKKIDARLKTRSALSLTADLGKALWASYDYEKKVNEVKKGGVKDLTCPRPQVQDDPKAVLTYAVWVPAKYDARKAYPLVLLVPDKDQKPAQHITEKWTDAALRDEAILAAVPMPDDLAAWTEAAKSEDGKVKDGGLSNLLAVLIDLRSTVAVDFDRVYLVGSGEGVRAACAFAARFPDSLAGVAGRSGDVPEKTAVEPFKNLPTFFAGAGAGATAFSEALTKEKYDNCTIKPEAKEADLWAWMKDHPRIANPAQIVLVAEPNAAGRSYWVSTPRFDAPVRLTAVADRGTNTITIDADGATEVVLSLNDQLVDLDKEVKFVRNGIETVEKIPRNLTTTLGFMRGTTSRDPGRIYVASKRLDIPSKPKPKDKPKDK